jgi:hypothetical protein
MLLRLAYLGVANAFSMLRLLPMSDRDKAVEILALRHQITVLERQLGKEKVRFSPGDRAFLAALLHRLPQDVLRRLRLLVRPDTVLRWHRNLAARRALHPRSGPAPGPGESCRARKVIAAGWARASDHHWHEVRVIISLLYKVARRLLSVPGVLLRSDTAKAAEVLVLRHENTVLRRQLCACQECRPCRSGTSSTVRQDEHSCCFVSRT